MLTSMTTPTPSVDPILVQRLSDEFVTLSQQLGRAATDLGILRAQLGTISSAPVPAAPLPVPPQANVGARPPQWQPSYPVPPQPVGWQPQQRFPYQPQQYRPQPNPSNAPLPNAPLPKREPWWQRDGVVSRLLAFAGAGVTLVGVVMLLVLAAQAGFFGPVARVVSGAAFSIALVGLGMRVYSRPGGTVGGIALAATGIAGLYLDVIAVATIYGWIVPPLGLLVALGVCAFGIALAAHWDSQPLALLVVTGVALLAPVVTDGPTLTLVGFLLVIQIGCFPVQLVRGWPHLHIARTVPVVLGLVYAISAAAFDDGTTARWLLASAVVTALIGTGTAIAAAIKNADDHIASIMLAVSAVPLLMSPLLVGRFAVGVIAGLVSVAALGIALVRRLPVHTRLAGVAVAVVSLIETSLTITEFETYPIGFLVLATGFIAAAGQERSRIVYRVGVGFAMLGGAAFYATAPLDSLVLSSRAVDDLDPWVIVSGLLLAAVSGLAVWQAKRLGSTLEVRLIASGLVALYAITASAVAAGVALAGADGFTGGHCAATILWMIAATALLLLGLRGKGDVRITLGAGLGLTGAALGKLFLFDLATLDGLVRVLAFVVVGLLLLVAGTRYAREFAERGNTASD